MERILLATAALTRFYVVILVLGLAAKGFYVSCSLDDITIDNHRSEREIGGKPEGKVTVINNCRCSLSRIRLSCKGFQTMENIDPGLFLKQGDTCLIKGGSPLAPSGIIKFSYAWDPPFLLLPSSSNSSNC